MEKKRIQFNFDPDLYETLNLDDDVSEASSTGSKKKSSFLRLPSFSAAKFLKRHSDGDRPSTSQSGSKFSKNKRNSDNAKSKRNNSETRSKRTSEAKTKQQKAKLIEYLQKEKPIVKKEIQIDCEEQELLDQLAHTHINIEKFLKFPEPKAKDKLWRIPYFFRNSTVEDDPNGPSSINRFGEGVPQGCMVSLNLPRKATKKSTTWSDLIDISDEVLEQLENAKWSRLNQNRRGSILQPRHVFLEPNPEAGSSSKLASSRNYMVVRDWASQLSLNCEEPPLLETEFKLNICKNASMEDLSQMLFPELKNSFTGFGQLTNSEIEYIQKLTSRRRQSLMPPNFEGQSDISFRRQSYGGNQLWSTKLENLKQRMIYQQKLKLINPEHFGAESEEDSESVDGGEPEVIENPYPVFDYRSKEQAKLFANELTLIVRQYFNSVKSNDIVHFMTNPNGNILNRCTNIKALMHFKSRTIRLIATYVLKQDQLEQRVEAILFFINVIRELKSFNNWHSANVVTQSLQSPPVIRLKDTWRSITFNHADSYCFFIEISELFSEKKHIPLYDTVQRFIPIFGDVIEQIKERCGLKIVQISQHRLHSNWGATRSDTNYVQWMNQEVNSLMEDAQLEQLPKEVEKKSRFKGLFKRKSKSNTEDTGNEEAKEEEGYNDIVYRQRLLTGLSPAAANSALPSTRQFWKISEYNKLRSKDKELIKQEIVRTLVAFQKKAFFVFEDRDEVIKDFLLNASCDSIDTCMQKSIRIESNRHRKQVPPTPTGSYISSELEFENEKPAAEEEEEEVEVEEVKFENTNVNVEQKKSAPVRIRRVMFDAD